jgi:hypothetical protein
MTKIMFAQIPVLLRALALSLIIRRRARLSPQHPGTRFCKYTYPLPEPGFDALDILPVLVL